MSWSMTCSKPQPMLRPYGRTGRSSCQRHPRRPWVQTQPWSQLRASSARCKAQPEIVHVVVTDAPPPLCAIQVVSTASEPVEEWQDRPLASYAARRLPALLTNLGDMGHGQVWQRQMQSALESLQRRTAARAWRTKEVPDKRGRFPGLVPSL